MRYLRDTFKLYLCFEGSKYVLVDYTDANIAYDVDLKKFTSGYLITFTEESGHGSENYKSVLLFPLLK